MLQLQASVPIPALSDPCARLVDSQSGASIYASRIVVVSVRRPLHWPANTKKLHVVHFPRTHKSLPAFLAFPSHDSSMACGASRSRSLSNIARIAAPADAVSAAPAACKTAVTFPRSSFGGQISSFAAPATPACLQQRASHAWAFAWGVPSSATSSSLETLSEMAGSGDAC